MNQFERAWLTVFFIELFAGGGGRLIEFGSLSIRQLLFVGLFLLIGYRLIRTKTLFDVQRNPFLRLDAASVGVYLLVASFTVSLLMGILAKHPLSFVVTDFFRVIFIMAFFPLAFYVSEQRFSQQRIVRLLKWSALVVAIFTVVLAVLGKTVFYDDYESFKTFWKSIMPEDLLFRVSHSVFYKSHFYVFIGLILSLNDVCSKRYTKLDGWNIVFSTLSIFWSDTRGLSIAVTLGMMFIVVLDVFFISKKGRSVADKWKLLITNKALLVKGLVTLFLLLAVPYIYQYTTKERFKDQQVAVGEEVKDTSVGARIDFLLDAKEILLAGPKPFLIGEGYGTAIAGRIEGIEMTFLDIWVEQGAIGLSIWLYLCLLVFFNYYLAYRQGVTLTTLDRSLLGAFLGMLLLTNINPFLNNPIGMIFFVLMIIFSQQKRTGAQSPR